MYPYHKEGTICKAKTRIAFVPSTPSYQTLTVLLSDVNVSC